MAQFSAKVKSIVSGDTLILTPIASKNADQERTLALAFVTSPRLSEIYGFDSREFLRTLLVGKQIQFKVLYDINGREYGDIITPVFGSLIERSLQDGNVKLRDDASNKSIYEQDYKEKLEKAQEKAKTVGTGIWKSNVNKIDIESVVPAVATSSANEYNAIIERVIAGDRVQLRVLINKKAHFVGPALIAGIKAPRSASADTAAEPFGEAAKQFVSTRLLQRSVKTKFLETASSSGVPIVSIIHPAGDIAQLLLSNGLATIADWQSQYLGSQKMLTLRQAERAAKEAKVNLWKDLQTPPSSSSSGNLKSFEAIIARVVSPDTYVVRTQSNEEQTVQLASIRGPRKADDTQAPFVNIAKEFARSKLIGKKVILSIEAIRPQSEQFDERALVTMKTTQDNHNIALTLVDSGYATVIRHRKEDQDRSPIWDELMETESIAVAKTKGMHSKKAPPPERLVDASENVTKARGFLSSLERQGRIPAVVDYVSSGGRLRLVVKKENCTLTLVFAGVRVPRPNEPQGNAALELVSRRIMQRDVQISVVNVDKTGGFIGHVFLPGSNLPLSVGLVKEGLAEVHEYSAHQSGFGQQLTEAEDEAKKLRKGLWENYEEPVVVEEAFQPVATEEPVSGKKSYIDVVVTDVSATGEVSYRLKSSDAQFSKLNADLNSFNNAAANQPQFAFKSHVKRGDSVTVKTSATAYARARLTSFEKPDSYTVLFLDTGKIETVGLSSLRPLPSQFSTSAIPAVAKTADLSFVQLPPASYLDDYVSYLQQIVKQSTSLVANVDSPQSAVVPSITLYTADSAGPQDSVNAEVINEGYAFVKTALNAWERNSPLLEGLKTMEQTAKADRIGVWEYGDPRQDE